MRTHTSWLDDLARTLLISFGIGIEYNVEIDAQWHSPSDADAMEAASKAFTARLRDIIRTIEHCRRLLEPVGWRQLKPEEREPHA
jgi:hypothetical protein